MTTLVTLQALEGLERGQVYKNLEPPITLGREEENTVRLNDERVSRFHAKIQVDQGKLIFTDLGSTNGSRVNGIPAQMHVLQVGDQISIGRCLLVLGNDDELAKFLRLITRQQLA
ncbi:MAG: FHA domain-containing protein [Planctomycetaceae bacterium]